MAAEQSGLAIGAALLIGGAAAAHHSPAAYDMTNAVTVEGTIAEVVWKNPHIYLTVETTDAAGQPLLQEIEVGPLSAVQTYGLTQDAVALGSHVVVRVNPNRRGEGRIARGLNVSTDDGTVYALADRGLDGADAPVAVVPADGLAGSWVSQGAGFSAFGRAASAWPLTGAARAARDAPRDEPLALGLCEPYPAPAIMTVPSQRTIEVGETAVVMRIDSAGMEEVRTVHLDQAEHPVDVEPTVQGHSIGRWEGETLVIDTVAFAVHPVGVSIGVPSGPEKHMVERLTLTEDRLHLQYEFTMEDPAQLAEPVSFSMLWDHRPDVQPSGVACDPEIARRYLEE